MYPQLAVLLASLAAAQQLSCSAPAPDPCLSPSPGGLFVFRQRHEPDTGGDFGSWGIDGVEVLHCETQLPQDTITYGPTYSHEEVGSYCLKSPLFAGENAFVEAEKEWAQSEVGEGVEEVWERAWNTAGRYISTLSSKCFKKPSKGVGVPQFFAVLQQLNRDHPTGQLLADRAITCDNTTLSAVSWPLAARGSFQEGAFEPASGLERAAGCPSDGIIYQPSTARPVPSETASWDSILRPSPRPITLSHDESKVYRAQQPADPRQKLAMFKEGNAEKDEWREERAQKKFGRDEL
ncbi:hypothetical protein L198_00530 [Cryptococcus wingfieldii CBS 7118]|uniref:Uncharacterized protein n=1 Tax=Cryptococcus wingfieldii CBS 7118 TaxID=1295528 RepID=A0A1E3K8E7_9TREE|nr:hypothetical protein L198_00530 [Cryptococcus wingfieldii CBS 7118]ODO08797.1 hypothetical protein L198_00530 [Cryptococcus wingfieldii CBS 7118]